MKKGRLFGQFILALMRGAPRVGSGSRAIAVTQALRPANSHENRFEVALSRPET